MAVRPGLRSPAWGRAYFEANIGEGLRNAFIVTPGGKSFILTTQKGAFEVISQPGTTLGGDPSDRWASCAGWTVKDSPDEEAGRARSGERRPDDLRWQQALPGVRLLRPYASALQLPEGGGGDWVRDRQINGLPSEMDLLSIQFDDARPVNPRFMYVGTGDQAYLLNLHTMRWSRVDGVGADSAIHGMTVVGGLHIAACWGVYNPVGPGMVSKVTSPSFLYHVTSDEAGPNVRAYSVDVDPAQLNRAIVTSITGVYMSDDKGVTWHRINSLPEGEYRTAHFSSDGTVLVSGMPGTFLIRPFDEVCRPRLKRR